MEIFGLPLQEFIFSIFLPFILFYILLYALLRKTEILGPAKEANRFNSLMSLVISALAVFSLYYLGLTTWLPYIAAFLAVVAFLLIYVFGVTGYALKKTSSYTSGEAFKTEDEKKFDAGVKTCEGIWEEMKKTKDPKILQQLVEKMDSEISKIEPIAPKLGKSLYEFDWYKKYKELKKEG